MISASGCGKQCAVARERPAPQLRPPSNHTFAQQSRIRNARLHVAHDPGLLIPEFRGSTNLCNVLTSTLDKGENLTYFLSHS
jgi:hypothetical protein